MGISVNGIDITDAAIEQEIRHHQQTDNPLKQTVHELVLRTVLLQEADRLGITGEDDDARVETLFAREVRVPEVDAAACSAWYEKHPDAFTQGEMIEARHILFQVTPTVPLDLLRETGEAVLEELKQCPDRFSELAKQYSNCPSGQLGGCLGQLTRGQTVPEFERFVFRMEEGELAGRLLETRFGLHIVQVLRRLEGRRLPFDAVRSQISGMLAAQSWQRALHQYLHILVGRADIRGIALEGATSPLIQ